MWVMGVPFTASGRVMVFARGGSFALFVGVAVSALLAVLSSISFWQLACGMHRSPWRIGATGYVLSLGRGTCTSVPIACLGVLGNWPTSW